MIKTKNSVIGKNNSKFNYEVDVIPTVDNVDYHRDYFFTNLDVFGVSKDNRDSDIDDTTVKKYYKMMMDGEWFFELSPIYVGISTLEITNGEHRRKAINKYSLKTGERPVVYVRFFDDTEQVKEKIKALNSGKHWNCDDYCNTEANNGNKAFKFLRDFCLDEDHPQLHKGDKPNWNKGAVVLGITYTNFKTAYQTGEWDLSYEDTSTSEKRYAEIVRIKKAFRLDEASQDCWIPIAESWCDISKDKDLMDRINRLPDGIETFYRELTIAENTNSSKRSVWYDRMITALENAERKSK